MSVSRRDLLKLLAAAGSWPWLVTWGTESMRTRPIPASGEALPVVGLGTWQAFDVGGGETEREPLRKVLRMLLDRGGRVVDSSPMYGRAEQVAGQLSTEMRINDELFLATKVWTSGREAGLRQMQQSLERLGRERLDLMQVHNLVDWRTQLQSMRAWQETGRLRYLGLTHYVSAAYAELEAILARERLAFVQFNYSIGAREAEQRLLPFCADRGVAVIVNRPYQGGGLFGRVRGKALPHWAAEFDAASWGQFFLKYILAHPAVTCVIPGTDRPDHLADNVGAGFGGLPDDRQRRRMVEFIENT